MADIGWILIAVDDLWPKADVPPEDREEVLRAASHGLQIALLTHGDPACFSPLRRVLGLDFVCLTGPPYEVEVKGRVTLTRAATAEELLAHLTTALSSSTMVSQQVMAVGATHADLDLLLAAGTGVWVENDVPEADDLRAAADMIVDGEDAALPGVAAALGAVALRNNRFLRPFESRGRSILKL